MAKAKLSADNPGLVIPVDVEALCIGKNPGPIFTQVPFDFAGLKTEPYLSSSIQAGGRSTMSQGVHLHWALPDALTKGKEGSGSVDFPAAPDRWLVTRIFCDPDSASAPRFDRWVVESNHFAPEDPNQPLERTAVAVPYQGAGWEDQPWRYLGKVSDFTTWLKRGIGFAVGGPESYVAGLSAVGYGTTDFAAFYQNSQSAYGFNDLAKDLNELGTAGSDKYLSYQIIGWYSNPSEDPIRQLPARLPVAAFDNLLSKITEPNDRQFLREHFAIVTYGLIENVSRQTGLLLWDILQKAGYPLEVDIPQEIDPAEFQAVLDKTTNPKDKAVLQDAYLAKLAPAGKISEADQLRLWQIMAEAGYDFLSDLLDRAHWALPSGTKTPATAPSFTLYSGLISNIKWNAESDYFLEDPAQDFNIAVGNTAGEALSALIANTSGLDPEQVPVVEEILDALQAGILPLVKTTNMLKDWELLEQTLHQNAFGSARGGTIWEVQARKDAAGTSGEITLPAGLALKLNELNISQLQLNELETSIASIRSQIFSDWYRFMWIYHNVITQPDLYAGDMAQYTTDKTLRLGDKIEEANQLVTSIDGQIKALEQALGKSYFLGKVSAPRYWQPNDPVMLFQGSGIDPSDRYGNDGRYMYDGTLVCRLTGQLVPSLEIPADAFGNTNAVTLDAAQFELIPNPDHKALIAGINAVVVDAGLINEDVIADEIRLNGVTTPLEALAKTISPLIHAFLSPDVPQQIGSARFDGILAAIAPADASFLKTWYTLTGSDYTLNPDPDDNTRLRIQYILNSTAYNPSQNKLGYAGLPFSEVGIQAWDGNPWLPYSLTWSVYYYPLQQTPAGKAYSYPADFITSQFKVGESELDYTGKPISLNDVFAQYENTIFLTPHANINLRKQLSSFIEAHPKDPIMETLKLILSKLGAKPVLSQALSGLDEALLMLKKEMQLPVADPQSSYPYDVFTDAVHQAVGPYNAGWPLSTNSYNPIRVGLMQVAKVTLVDVFGRNVQVNQPKLLIRARDMQQTVLKPSPAIYLPPRLTQAARLLFRWLSADDDTVEMNTHPATTPICGWVLVNHLDRSLWIYDSKGNVYGALMLNWDRSQVLWQCAPGSIYFGLDAPQFFDKLGVVNKHLKNFVLALYGNGGKDSAAYLDAFMQALDLASVTIEPGNYAQYQANAALLGRPLALVRASLNLELMGDPAYSQSWEDLTHQVNQDVSEGKFIWGNDHEFAKVNFPVKIGNVPQTEDGLAGYFKSDDYATFYCPAAEPGNPHVLPPPDDNLLVKGAADESAVVISMLIEPRGDIHASTGILPVKAINIPPDQYLDALEKLSLAFLSAPLLTSKRQLAMPLPAQSGGSWSWVENDDSAWSQTQQIAPVTVDAIMNYAPQQHVDLLNNLSKTALLYITNDTSLNVLTFSFVNRTKQTLVLTGGVPVAQPYQRGGSSIAFNFGTILSATIFEHIQVSAPAGWETQYFAAAAEHPALWSLAPKADITLAPGDSVNFTLQNISCPPRTQAGNFQIYYYALPVIPDSFAPLTLPVSVREPPAIQGE